MKQLLFILSAMMALQASAETKQGNFTLNGKVTDTETGFVFIRNLTKQLPDTVRIVNGELSIVGKQNLAPHMLLPMKPISINYFLPSPMPICI